MKNLLSNLSVTAALSFLVVIAVLFPMSSFAGPKLRLLAPACDSGPPPRSLCVSAGCASALVAQSRPQTPILRAATGTTPPAGSGALAACNKAYKTGTKEWDCCLNGIKRACKAKCTPPQEGTICPTGGKISHICSTACQKGCEARCGSGNGC